MKRTIGFTATLVVTVILLAVFYSGAAVGQGASKLDGKQIFLAQKCNMCHSVSTAGIERTTKSEKMAAKDLINIDKDAAALTKYIKKETDLDGKKHGKAWTGTDEELGAVVTWILQQKK